MPDAAASCALSVQRCRLSSPLEPGDATRRLPFANSRHLPACRGHCDALAMRLQLGAVIAPDTSHGYSLAHLITSKS